MQEADVDPLALELTNDLNNEKHTGTWEHEELATVKVKVFRGHTEGINSCNFCFDETRILTASNDKLCMLWDIESGEPIQSYEGHTWHVSDCHPNQSDTKFVTSSWDRTVRCWDMETGIKLWKGRHDGIVTCCRFSHNGKYAISGSDFDCTLKLWDASDGTLIKALKDHHQKTITSCRFSQKDDKVCTTSMDGTTKLWDIVSQKTTVTLRGHNNIISCCDLSRDERKLGTGSWDKTIQVWDISTGGFRSKGSEQLDRGHDGSISALNFSPDGSMLVSGSYDQTVVVWEVDGRTPTLCLKGHSDWVNDVCFSEDMKWVLSCSRDKTIRLWDIEEREHIPVVVENKRSMGLKIVQCTECGKPFSISQLEDPRELHICVFCRLQGSRKGIKISDAFDNVDIEDSVDPESNLPSNPDL